MAIIQTLTTSFKVELAQGLHNFTTGTGDVFKLALYTANADLGASTTGTRQPGRCPPVEPIIPLEELPSQTLPRPFKEQLRIGLLKTPRLPTSL